MSALRSLGRGRVSSVPQQSPGGEGTPTDPPAPAPLGGRTKRAFDLVAAGAALVVCTPVLLLLALALRLLDGGPAFYGHRRVGFGGTEFRCLKLRSMRVDGDAVLARHLAQDAAAAREWAETHKLKNDPRVTPLGKFLRSTSLDELPQLLNVLAGQMSLVGPRPVTRVELDRYGPAAAQYLGARPGLTGLWQVSGRNDVSYDARVLLDGEYVASWSFARDFSIVLQTVPALLAARGSY